MRRPSALLLLAGAPVCFAAEVMFASSESTCIIKNTEAGLETDCELDVQGCKCSATKLALEQEIALAA